MSIEYGERKIEIELNTIVDIKKFLVPFMRRNSLQEVKVQILNFQKESINSFHYSYVNGISQVNGDNKLSPFKPNFLNYIRSLGFEHGMTFYVSPCIQDEIISISEPVNDIVNSIKQEAESIVDSNEITMDQTGASKETIQISHQEKKKSKKNKKLIPKRKKPTNAERKQSKIKNQKRIHIDTMRSDMMTWSIQRMLTGSGKPTPDGYIALSSRILTRVTNRDIEEYREGLFLEYTSEQFLDWLKELSSGTKWLDIGAGNTYKNKNSHVFVLKKSNPGVDLVCYDPIYIGKNEFPEEAVFVGGYAQSLQFEENSFDIITSLQVFDKISEENHGVEVALLEALRVLKPNGILKIAPLNTLDMVYGIYEIQRTLGDEIQFIDVDVIGDQINITKTKAFSEQIIKKIKERVLFWNKQGRFESQPLSSIKIPKIVENVIMEL